jgi:hypothetical protein
VKDKITEECLNLSHIDSRITEGFVACFVNGINPVIPSIHKIEILTELTLYYFHGRIWIQLIPGLKSL